VDIFLDSADETEVRHWLATGVVDGGTTNPVILARDAPDADHSEVVRTLSGLYGDKPFSIEVTEHKVPVLGPNGTELLDVIQELTASGVVVNATACLTSFQAYLAIKAGAAYASLLWGRILDEGGDALQSVRQAAALRDRCGSSARLIVASMRSVGDAYAAHASAADIATLPPHVLRALMHHHYSAATARELFGEPLSVA
jgi:transaldolase